MSDTKPHLYMIGGANGSGKTTTAMTLLPRFLETYEFVNADDMARGINPLRPESASLMAGRMMVGRVQSLIKAHKNFAFETTCAGYHHVHTIEEAHKAGYITTLIFLWLPSVEMALQRVQNRMHQGGHNVPEQTIRRRYSAGLQNLMRLFLPLVHKTVIYDNTVACVEPLHKIAEKKDGIFTIHDHVLWDEMKRFQGDHNV